MILQSAVFCILFTLGLIAGGGSSAANAADVQDDYYGDNGLYQCDNLPDNLPDDHPAVENCDNFARLRNSQSAGAVSA